MKTIKKLKAEVKKFGSYPQDREKAINELILRIKLQTLKDVKKLIKEVEKELGYKHHFADVLIRRIEG